MLPSFPAYSETAIRDSMHDNLCRAGDFCLIGFDLEAVTGAAQSAGWASGICSLLTLR